MYFGFRAGVCNRTTLTGMECSSVCRQFPEPISLCDFGPGLKTNRVHQYVIGKKAVEHVGERKDRNVGARSGRFKSKNDLAGCFGLDGMVIRVTVQGVNIQETAYTKLQEEYAPLYCDEVMDESL